jgi:hypothetical protein
MPNFGKNFSLSASELSLLLLSLSIITWTVAIYYSKLDIGNYGIISGLNPLYFVSITILSISFFYTIKKNIANTKLLILHTTFLVIFISLIPALFEGTPRFYGNFHSSSNIDYILQYGHSNNTLIPYQSWPGIFYFGTIFSYINNVDTVKIILMVSMILFYINILVNYLIFSTFLNKRAVWAALLLSNVLFFGSPVYFVPGVLGTLMITLAIITVLRLEVVNSRASLATWIIFLIFSGSAVVSHFLSSVSLAMALLFFAILTLIYLLVKNKYSKEVEMDTNSKIEKWGGTLNFIIKFSLVMVMVVTFQVYVAGSYSVNNIMNSINSIFNFGLLITQTAQMGFAGSESHTQAVLIRIISAVILISLAAMGFLYGFFNRKDRELKDLIVPTWIVSNSSITLITSYSGEIVSRTFSLSFNLFNTLAAKLIYHKYLSIVFLAVLIMAPPLSIINAYGNEEVDYIAPTEIAGADFLFNHLYNGVGYPNGNEGSYVRSLTERTLLIRYSQSLHYYKLEANLTNWNDVFPSNLRGVFKNYYVIISDRDIQSYNFISVPVNIDLFKSIKSVKSYSKIYDNKEYNIYYLESL